MIFITRVYLSVHDLIDKLFCILGRQWTTPYKALDIVAVYLPERFKLFGLLYALGYNIKAHDNY